MAYVESLVACDAALSQRLTRLQCFGRNSGDEEDDDSNLIHAAAMSGQQFDEVLQAKVALLQPALHTHVRVNPDFPVVSKKTRLWYAALKRDSPTGMKALVRLWRTWRANKEGGGAERTPESNLPTDETLRSWVEAIAKDNKEDVAQGQCCVAACAHCTIFNALTWLIFAELFANGDTAYEELRSQSAHLHAMFWEDRLAKKTRTMCLVPDSTFLWLLRAWLVGCLPTAHRQ